MGKSADDRLQNERKATTIKAEKGGRRPLPIPRSYQSAADYGSLVNIEDIELLIKAVRLNPKSSSHTETIRSELERLLMDFVLSCRASDASDITQIIRWIKKLERTSDLYLESFNSAEGGGEVLEAAATILRGPSGHLEVPNTSWSPRQDVEAAGRAVHTLNKRARAARKAYEAVKTGKRSGATLEMALYQRLGLIFVDMFEATWGVSSDREGRHSGPPLRFCKAIGDLLDCKAPLSSRGTRQLKAAIDRLRNPDRAADRIRESIGGGLRKR